MSAQQVSRDRGVGRRVKAARAKAGLTQRELAERIGVTPSAVAQWELGSSDPGMRLLAALATVLEVSCDWLVIGRPTPGAEQGGTGLVAIEAGLVNEARELGVAIEAELTDRLRQRVRDARRERWLAENRGAIEDANAFLARQGLWSDGQRQF